MRMEYVEVGSQEPVISITAFWNVCSDAEQLRRRYTMHVTRTGALAMLVITVLWAATPAIACLVPMHAMTQAEQDCCLKMAPECGSSSMPSSHSCCQVQRHETAVTPVSTYSPTRPFEVAIVPQTAILLGAKSSTFASVPAFDAPPPESSPGCSSILRI